MPCTRRLAVTTVYAYSVLHEVLLLHAEACAMTNDIAGANADLQRIRDRAGLASKDFSGMSQAEIMKEIEHQNFLEFCMEGHRFYDLRRYYTAAEVKQHFIDCGKVGGANFAENISTILSAKEK